MTTCFNLYIYIYIYIKSYYSDACLYNLTQHRTCTVDVAFDESAQPSEKDYKACSMVNTMKIAVFTFEYTGSIIQCITR